MFNKESDFEQSVIDMLIKYHWDAKVLKNPDKNTLLTNWANILYQNNSQIDKLDKYPLTNSEMAQIIEQINTLKTPLRLNEFINSKSVIIKRDNEAHKEKFNKEVSLEIYDKDKIASGQNTYQIAQQPIFESSSDMLRDRRGDLMLLINGMPVIHIELKRSGNNLSQAYNQIEKYSREGVFTGIFSLIQVFVAMTPEDSVYFANPGQNGHFNPQYYFRWANFDNIPIKRWDIVVRELLSIPMAHELIGYYTVADESDGVLKVLRSYQYWAVNSIKNRVREVKNLEGPQKGGYIWHTTGSGKTLTSFKVAQLIADLNEADKVVFLVDRIVLGKQTLDEYRSFADATDEIQSTEDTNVLITKLKSKNPSDSLIVTSIQKMSNITETSINSYDIKEINKNRIIFILDEAHRSVFGTMLKDIKDNFPNALLFGFTGTPIHDENRKKDTTTSDIFGKELHRYSISDGIRDGNVLGFDTTKVLTYKDNDLREQVALDKSKSANVDEAFSNSEKEAIFNKYYYLPMTDTDEVKGIESYINNSQYNRDEHRQQVVNDILNNWKILSKNGKFHAILATSSIPEAIEYYRLFKSRQSNLNITALFDPSEESSDWKNRQDGIYEILEDYNNKYDNKFTLANYDKFKTDIQLRLAHKSPYIRIESDQYLDILIVVDQMLTGYDSKYINTLYLDKVLKYENIVQSFSRTNRLFGPDKPFGNVKYYRKPHTMEVNIENAFETYSGDKPFGVFVDKLPDNIKKINKIYADIKDLFQTNNIFNFEKLPDDLEERNMFAQYFNKLTNILESSFIQGFDWNNSKEDSVITEIDEHIYLILVTRYKELAKQAREQSINIPYEIIGHLTEIDTARIDFEYMNNRYEKYLKAFKNNEDSEITQQLLSELHKTLGLLSQDDQVHAQKFLFDIKSGNIVIEDDRSFSDYITTYKIDSIDSKIDEVSKNTGIPKYRIAEMYNLNLNESTLNEYGRFSDLIEEVDHNIIKQFFEDKEQIELSKSSIKMKTNTYLRDFILKKDIND